MKYIVENWFVIVGLIAVLAAGGYAIYVFVKMPSDKQLNKVREWLLYAVTKAEKELGGGTGQIKLRYVYDMFVARFIRAYRQKRGRHPETGVVLVL